MQTYQISVEDKDSILLLQILRNLKIVQDIQTMQVTQNEHDSWTFSTAQLLNSAYSETEPNYENVPLRTINPRFIDK